MALQINAAKVGELQNGQIKEIEVGESGKILLIKEGDEYHAIGNKCTHYGAPLKSGAYSAGRIRCPWHGACFNVKTGDIEDYPALEGIHTFPTSQSGEDIIVTVDTEKVKNHKRTPHLCPRNESNNQVFAIIGGGPCGLTAAQTLRENGFDGRIVLYNKEPHLPYDRIKLSKAMNTPADRIALRPSDWFTANQIEIKLATEVTKLDAEKQVIEASDGSSLHYDRVLIASGAAPRTLPIPGHDLKNIFVLREVEQAASICSSFEGKKVVIVGSSFIGMEVAAFVAKKATSVTVIGMEKVPFERVLGSQVGAVLQTLHEQNGVKFMLERITKEYRPHDDHQSVRSVVLDNGTELEADIVVLGAGVIPSTKFISDQDTEIKKFRDGSIIVDKFMRTSNANVYAAGDLARFPLPLLADHETRIEHYGIAQYQGRIAALNMIKEESKSFNSVPFFWTTIFGKSVRYTGHALFFDDVIFHQDPSDKFKFLAYYLHQNKVTAVCSLARDPVASAAAELFHQNRMPSPDLLRDPSFDLLKLLNP